MGESNTRRVVMLGKTGSGKSSLANTIFGKKLFKTSDNFNSETSRCEAQTIRSLTLVDTPGLFDTDRAEEDLKPEIVRCIIECAPGPHAFLIVLKVEKFTEHEKAVINKIIEYFSEEALQYAVVLFTHGEQLPKGKKIEDFVNQNKSVEDLVKKCGNRCHVIDNKYWNGNGEDQYRNNQFQVEQLMKTIDKMKKNQERCYTNEVLQAVQEEIKQEEENIKKSQGNMSGEEITQRAKARVFNRFCIRAAGVTTGTLIGALCGVAAMVAAVFTGLKMSAKTPRLKKALQLTVGALVSGGSSGGAAAAGEAAAAGTCAAGGTVAAAAGNVGAALTIAAAVLGAGAGGVRGYHASEEAETPWQAVKMTAGAIKDDTLSVFDSAVGSLGSFDRILHLQSGQDGKPK